MMVVIAKATGNVIAIRTDRSYEKKYSESFYFFKRKTVIRDSIFRRSIFGEQQFNLSYYVIGRYNA